MPDIGLLQGAPPRRASPPPTLELQPAAAFTARVDASAATIAERFAALPAAAIVVVSEAAPPRDSQQSTSQPPPVRSATRVIPPISSRDLFWLALALLVIIGTGIGIRDPWPADEPRF